MKILHGLLVSIVSFGFAVEVSAQQAGGQPDLAAQLQRLNAAVAGGGSRTGINPQVTPQSTPTLSQPGGAPVNEQSIARALDQVEQAGALTPQARQQAEEQARQQLSPDQENQQAQQQQAQAEQAQQMQQQMHASIPLRDEAFEGMTKQQLPLSPGQVKTLKKMFTDVQRAQAADPGSPPRPTSTSVVVNLSPGATPPVIRLQAGFVSSLVFLDATGTAWPITAYDLGDPRSFNIQWNKKSNTLMVQAISQYKVGNLAVVLEGLTTPIMITLIPGQKAVDYRVDLRVPIMGPNAQIMHSSLPGKSDPQLLNVLNGVAPSGSKSLDVSGGDAEIWKYHGKLFVRTRMTIVSPGWISHLRSADGMQAYHINKTPVILASLDGKLHKLIVKGL